MAAQDLATGVNTEFVIAPFKCSETVEVRHQSNGITARVRESYVIDEEAIGNFVCRNRVNWNREDRRVLTNNGDVDVKLVSAPTNGSPIKDLLFGIQGKGNFGKPLTVLLAGANSGEMRNGFTGFVDREMGAGPKRMDLL